MAAAAAAGALRVLPKEPTSQSGSEVMVPDYKELPQARSQPEPHEEPTTKGDDDKDDDFKESLHTPEDVEMELPATGEYTTCPLSPPGETMADLGTDSDLSQELRSILDGQVKQDKDDEEDDKRRKKDLGVESDDPFCPNCRTFGHLIRDCPQPACCFVCLSKEHLQKDCPMAIPGETTRVANTGCSTGIWPWSDKEAQIEAALVESIREKYVKESGSSSKGAGP